MQMTEGLDTGPVFVMEACAIGNEDTSQTLHDRLAALGASLLVRHLPAILDGAIEARAQNETGVTYASKLNREEERLDFTRPAAELARQVRGFAPAPGAYTLVERAHRL